ncbi:MAG: flagellar biosynthetic protein FliR [Actinomycetia bacterium]|nr:flagellar biosynthetic protein FliR [Actinomycetes bacterium]MCP4223865.1 flagellar biosynthetic protein FliR [Actinomycetes bacterium]MCP5035307.1 flagellar biosynthetic protein FliR [Actinomycetes bacterium]
MNLAIPPSTIVAFLLVMTRLITVFTVAPPFGGSLLPIRVRVAIAAAIALLIAPIQTADVPLDAGGLIGAIAYQVLVGAVFGYLIQLLLSAPLIAGMLIDNMAGLAAASLFDPMSNSSATPGGRLNQLIATVLLVGLEGHLLIVRGVLRSYEAAPVSGLQISSLDVVLTEGIGQLLLAAIEIALPLLVALLMTEAVLGLSARAAPRLNVMILGFAVKGVVFMLGFALTLPLLINAVSALLERSLRWAITLSGG